MVKRESIPTLTDHFREVTKMIPLTLDQLRKMDDQPVKVKNLKYAESRLNTGVVAMYDPNDSDNGVYVGCAFFCIKDYGKDWVAYAYPPAHIDRDAWTAEWRGLHGDKMVGPDDCGNDVYRHYHYSVCTSCGKGSAVKSNFCPVCGKAMTPQAWAELEKRMGVK